MISVAIDGPGGAGKSTIAKAAAANLGYIYVDTGALYRSIALFVLSESIDPADVGGVCSALAKILLDIRFADGAQQVFLNDENVSDKIRTPEVSAAASKISAIPEVRAFLLDTQRRFAENGGVIMDGRDIGTVVLPNAELKIFLTASPEARARRRFDELKNRGVEVEYSEVLHDLKERDYQDSHREIAPLKAADDAVLVDTSELTLEQSIEKIIGLIKAADERAGGNKGDRSGGENAGAADEERRAPADAHAMKNDDTGLTFRLKTGPNKLVNVLRVVLWPLYRAVFWYRVHGKKNMPKQGGFIFCANHIAAIDPIFWVVSSPRRVHFMAKEELFKNPIAGRFLRAVDVFAIKRGARDMSSIGFASELVKNGEVLGIYPEGTRSKDGRPGRAKSGVAFLANETGADVVPAAIIVKGNKKLAPFRPFKLVIGKPIPHSEIAFDEAAKDNLKRVSKRIMDEITAVWEENQF
ncbi:MAG: (d)CMP kinase [Acutalibacteraceae bacterium]